MSRRMTLGLVMALAVLFAMLQYALWFGHNGMLDLVRLKRDVAALKAHNEELAERNRKLEAEVVDLQQGLKAVEERARAELGLIRPGETFYQIVTPAEDHDG